VRFQDPELSLRLRSSAEPRTRRSRSARLNTSTFFSGEIEDFDAVVTLHKSGTGTLALSGTNTYSGGTIVSGGLINFSTVSNFGTAGITLDGGGLQWEGNALDISYKMNPFGAAGATFDTNGNDVALNAGITGAGGITKSGAGVLTLGGPVFYIGTTTVTGGLINFFHSANFGLGNIILYGGGLQWAPGSAFDISAKLDPIFNATFDTNGNDVTLASNISGFGLTKTARARSLSPGPTVTLEPRSTAVPSVFRAVPTSASAGDDGRRHPAMGWSPQHIRCLGAARSPRRSGGTFDTNGHEVTFATAVQRARQLHQGGRRDAHSGRRQLLRGHDSHHRRHAPGRQRRHDGLARNGRRRRQRVSSNSIARTTSWSARRSAAPARWFTPGPARSP
jgi:autotransporter-associated beta strand protein